MPVAKLITRLCLFAALLCAALVVGAVILSRMLPDMGAVVYYSDRNGLRDIYALDIRRGTIHNLTRSGTVTNFALSDDHLAFEAYQSDNITRIYLRDMKCSSMLATCGIGVRQLTDNVQNSRYPAWSPDGSQLAFIYIANLYDSIDNELVVINFEENRTLSLPYRSREFYPPVWSPDNRRIALVSDAGRYNTLYTIGLDGSELQLLRTDNRFDDKPAWSPDGIYLMYVAQIELERYLYLVSADGGDAQLLASDVGLGGPPVWSPDSSQIAYIANRSDGDHFCIIDVNTGNIRSLSTESFLFSHFIWSEDGRYILLNRFIDGDDDIYRIEVESGQLTRLTYNGNVGFPTSWQP
jgi:Tol biopolymer transport system component